MDPESASNNNESMEPSKDIPDGNGSITPNLDILKDIELQVTLRFGSAQMSLKDLAGLNSGSVIELDRALADPVEVLVGGHVIAHGEPVVVEGVYGIRISEIASRQERLMTTSLSGSGSGGNAA